MSRPDVLGGGTPAPDLAASPPLRPGPGPGGRPAGPSAGGPVVGPASTPKGRQVTTGSLVPAETAPATGDVGTGRDVPVTDAPCPDAPCPDAPCPDAPCPDAGALNGLAANVGRDASGGAAGGSPPAPAPAMVQPSGVGLAAGQPPDQPEDLVTPRANALALAHQAGDPEALPALIELLRPLLGVAMHRYVTRSLVLPASLDLEDLRQQSWIILDGLARRWEPAGGDFPAYVRTTYLWELWRYVRSLSPGRRARAVRVDNVQHDTLLERLGERTGLDGRLWDDRIVATEMLNGLDPIARWAVLLHVLEERSFQDVARALRITQAGAYRAYRRALDQLRLRAGLELDPDDALARKPGVAPAVERLVRALHDGAGPTGRLPGRATVCAQAGVSEMRFARLMGLLVTRGCVVGRSARKPGQLVHGTAEQTLDHLRRRPEPPAPAE